MDSFPLRHDGNSPAPNFDLVNFVFFFLNITPPPPLQLYIFQAHQPWIPFCLEETGMRECLHFFSSHSDSCLFYHTHTVSPLMVEEQMALPLPSNHALGAPDPLPPPPPSPPPRPCPPTPPPLLFPGPPQTGSKMSSLEFSLWLSRL